MPPPCRFLPGLHFPRFRDSPTSGSQQRLGLMRDLRGDAHWLAPHLNATGAVWTRDGTFASDTRVPLTGLVPSRKMGCRMHARSLSHVSSLRRDPSSSDHQARFVPCMTCVRPAPHPPSRRDAPRIPHRRATSPVSTRLSRQQSAAKAEAPSHRQRLSPASRPPEVSHARP